MQTNEQTQNSYIPTVRFEGFFLQMVMLRKIEKCQEIVRKVLGSDWEIKQIGDNLTEFEITLHDDALSVKQAWDKTYDLKMQPEVIDAEPLFAIPFTEDKDIYDPLSTEFADIENQNSNESDNVNWCLEQMHVLEAWKQYFPDPNKLPGAGIIIAHPDTGYTPHPEIANSLLLEKSYDFIKKDQDATDPLQESGGEIINNPGHGTSTASVIISPPGKEGNYSNDKFITGVAPGAKLVPLRVSYSVALLSVRNLAVAIEYAADNDCHAIAISLGAALHNKRLRTAILYAQKRGVIIVAASGTFFPYVVYPAAYDEVIAVCGSTIERKIWKGASRGKRVDVTAPGHEVWYAKTDKKDDSETLEYRIEKGSGTSFSAPLVTGVAALWLSYHGRDKLIERYGAEKIPFIFNQILRDTCDKFPTWKPNKFGTGIVNAQKLLAAPLPDNINQSIIAPALALQQHTPLESGELSTFMHLFEADMLEKGISDSNLCECSLNLHLRELLQTSETELPKKLKEVGQELAFHFASSPQMYQQFAKCLTQKQSSPSQPPQLQLQSQGESNQEYRETESVRNMLVERGISKILNRNISQGN
ncbi:MAG: S8 family serine peptidase [Cyanobacteria bacterium P01_A01_bin.45]